MSPENKDHYESEKEAIHLILTGIRDEIYSTIDACKIAHEINNLTVDKMQVNVQFLQNLISQLEIHGEVISQEDANLKLLRSLPSAWNNIALIMRKKSDLDT
ncbi:hypothetical protein Tco_1574150 [Tanacetum coccineum]